MGFSDTADGSQAPPSLPPRFSAQQAEQALDLGRSFGRGQGRGKGHGHGHGHGPEGHGFGPQVEEDPDASERDHFLEVCWSCFCYRADAMPEVVRFKALANALDKEDLKLWCAVPKLATIVENLEAAIDCNTRFLAMLPTPDVCGASLTRAEARSVTLVPQGHRPASRNTSKVRTTLRQFVRDWAVEGEMEREATYTPLIQALDRHLPAPPLGSRKRKPRVLCPGSGLGRLPFDLARLGYAAEGNEFSYHMLLGSHLIYNRTRQAESFVIFPFVLGFVNRRGAEDTLQPCRIPDICPAQSLSADCEVSMAAGEFVAVYERQLEEWDAVATAFFLDTAKNIFLYIRTIAAILRPGGVWTNLGPLLYHYAAVEDEVSVELSWEEVRPFLCKYFDIVEEEQRDASYTLNPNAMMRTVFHCIFFTAIRNNEPVVGQSDPVY